MSLVLLFIRAIGQSATNTSTPIVTPSQRLRGGPALADRRLVAS